MRQYPFCVAPGRRQRRHRRSSSISVRTVVIALPRCFPHAAERHASLDSGKPHDGRMAAEDLGGEFHSRPDLRAIILGVDDLCPRGALLIEPLAAPLPRVFAWYMRPRRLLSLSASAAQVFLDPGTGITLCLYALRAVIICTSAHSAGLLHHRLLSSFTTSVWSTLHLFHRHGLKCH
jgi:hypothetical protein